MRLLALDIIKGLTASPEGIERLKAKMDALLPALLRLVPVPDPEPQASKASEESLICLVNLSQVRLWAHWLSPLGEARAA